MYDFRTDELREAYERAMSAAARQVASDRFWAELQHREPLVYSQSRIANLQRALKHRNERRNVVTNIRDRRKRRQNP